MMDATTLLLFLLAVLTLFLSPGPNMAFVMSHGMAYGPRGGLAAAIGIGSADVVLTALTATGVTAMVFAWSTSFDVLRIAGAAYLMWLAIKTLRSPAAALMPDNRTADMAFHEIARNAMLGSLLNPKALLFFVVFLPQFVDPAKGSIAMQLVLLGLTLSAASVVFNTTLGAFSGQLGKLVQRHPGAATFQKWLLGSVLAALAVRMFLTERPVGR
jgi:threonine/homoserine/homoserine lactone efflux protein